MKSLILFTLGLVAASIISGCAAKELNPAAAKIIVTRNAAPKGCKFKGSVIGEQGGSLLGGLTSNKALAEGSLNDMKNKAFDLGANYVVLETNTTGESHSRGSGGQTDVTKTGNAYACPPDSIGL